MTEPLDVHPQPPFKPRPQASGPWTASAVQALSAERQRHLLDFVRSSYLLYSLSEPSTLAVLHKCEFVQVPAEETLFYVGDPGDCFYMIVDGQIKIVRDEGDQELVMAELEEGDGFGEKALLEQSTRTATVRTKTHCTLLRLMARDWNELIAANPELHKQMDKLRRQRVSLIDDATLEDAPTLQAKFSGNPSLELDPATLELLLRLNEAAGGKGQNEHCKETAILSREMSRILCPGISEVLFYGGYLHEIGKIGLPSPLLHKQRRGEELTPEEDRTYRRIYRNALRIIKPDRVLHDALRFLEHMERDSYTEMSIEAQILTCAHEYLEGVSPHYQNRPVAEVTEQMRQRSGTRYNPRVLGALEQTVEKYSQLKLSRQIRFIRQMNIALDVKDNYTLRHSYHVRVNALKLGERLRLDRPQMDLLHMACDMHDVGKIYVPPEILNAPRKLTVEEFEVMKMHPVHSAEFLADIPGMRELQRIVRHHHERFDGKGYPDGLKGEEIPLLSRIEVIADVWSALSTPRVYRVGDDGRQKAFSTDEALSIMGRMQPGHFDPEIFREFQELVCDEQAMRGAEWEIVHDYEVDAPRF